VGENRVDGRLGDLESVDHGPIRRFRESRQRATRSP
jgi:hypothetical protein